MPPHRYPHKHKPISDPARMVFATMRLTEAERAKLHELAESRGVTLSWAMYEGARLLLTEWMDQLSLDRDTEAAAS